MVNWNGVDADVNVWLNKHYTAGRGGSQIQHIVIHHNAGVNLSTKDVYNIWQTREASAHYQVEIDGTIGQLVHDWDTAWHAGNLAENQRSIGIEHTNSGGAASGWSISDATREAGAHLVAALCVRYGLGRPTWCVNVFPHSNFSSTSCPAALASTYRTSYMSRAQEWYDSMTGGKGTTPSYPTASASSKKVTKTDGQLMLDVDGVPGSATYSRFQQVMGTTIDGVKSKPSQMVIAFQKFLNSVVSVKDIANLGCSGKTKGKLDVDGYDGTKTWKVFQYWAWNVRKELIKAYAGNASMAAFADGVDGVKTWKVLQHMLNESYSNSGKLLSK